MGNENTECHNKNHQNSGNIENYEMHLIQSLVNVLNWVLSKYEVHPTIILVSPPISLSSSLFPILVPLTLDTQY